jgi:integrase
MSNTARLSVKRRWNSAELTTKAEEFSKYLAWQGYSTTSINIYRAGIDHFVRWCCRGGYELTQVSETLIKKFLNRHPPFFGSRSLLVKCQIRSALNHFLKMLRADGSCQQIVSSDPRAIASELKDFDRHLYEVRGLAECTRAARLGYVRHFLIDRFGKGPINVAVLTPHDIASFMDRYTVRLAPGTIREVAIALRGYLRFKAIYGHNTSALIAALPRVARWRQAAVPQALSDADIQTLLKGFDRKSRIGRRDYAITRCLVDLGLRGIEVARLRLNDVDWREGVLRIYGKGQRIDTMPLPALTGQAIVDYLRHGRPRTTRREIFVRHRAPVNAPTKKAMIVSAVLRAARRCGLGARIRGAHIFRRTVACDMTKRGVPLKEIADILRHRSLDTTAIYAKVDFPSLAEVPLPWPSKGA